MEETLETRVIRLETAVEEQVTVHDLNAVQAVLSAQILQLGNEMRGGFSAIKEEIRTGDEQTRQVLREEIRAGDEQTRQVLREEIRTGDEQTRQVLREEIRTGDEEIRRHASAVHEKTLGALEQRTAELLRVMAAESLGIRQQVRALHEDVVGRLKLIERG